MNDQSQYPIGVISDTHGTVDRRALLALIGVSLILHAGDIGSPDVITQLEQIAPVKAVQGNVDAGTPLARRYPLHLRIEFAGIDIYMTHVGGRPVELAPLLPMPHPMVSIFGHSHRSMLENAGGVLFLNPGAAGRPRFGGGLSVARLGRAGGNVVARIISLEGVT
ncbi:MAG: metallophosphoesterase family protein [Herpetosiphon sp.]